MKKLILSIACAASFCACDAQHQLTVNYPNAKNDTIVFALISQDLRAYEKQDTVVLKNGTAVYDCQTEKARMLNIQYKTGSRMQHRIQAFIVPGEQGVITINENGGTWSGSQFYTDLALYESVKDPIEQKMQEIANDFQQQVNKGAKADSLRNIIMPQYMELSKQLGENDRKFIEEHPNSDVSATILMQLGEENAEEGLNMISESVKTGRFSNFVDNVKAQIERQKQLNEAKKAVAEGKVAPDFTLKDLNGNDLALSSLRGKYVVLDFWGSWCGWCIKGFPEMKKYYEEKYPNKFEILGVDCNDTEAKWKKAVEDNKLPWKHVYCPRTANITTMYAVSGFPTKIIIDPEGKIYKTIVGESPEFYTILDNLFGK